MDLPPKEVVPPELRALLNDSLTERGMRQWWNARLRLLEGFTPRECWATESNRERVMRAAHSFAEGFYI